MHSQKIVLIEFVVTDFYSKRMLEFPCMQWSFCTDDQDKTFFARSQICGSESLIRCIAFSYAVLYASCPLGRFLKIFLTLLMVAFVLMESQ